jgi:hypothetical protein
VQKERHGTEIDDLKLRRRELGLNERCMNKSEAKAFGDDFYKKIAARWKERVTDEPFMKNLMAGTLPRSGIAPFLQKLGLVHDRD